MHNTHYRLRALGRMITPVLVAALCLVGWFAFIGYHPAAAKAPKMTAPQQIEGLLITSHVITIGLATNILVPNLQDLSWPMVNAARLAISQTNEAGGVNIGGLTHTLVLAVGEDYCDASQAANTANALLAVGAKIVVGHLCSSTSLIAQPIYNASHVAMLSATSTNPLLTAQGYTNTFRIATNDRNASKLLAAYLWTQLGVKRAAVVTSASNDPFISDFTALGGMITSQQVIAQSSAITAALTTIQPTNPQVIVDDFDGSAANAGRFSKTAYNIGMTAVSVAWFSGSNDESILTTYANAAGSSAAAGDLVEMKFPSFNDMPGWSTFLAEYQAQSYPHNGSNPGLTGVLAYDATRLAIAAITRAGSIDPGAIRDQLALSENYTGVMGTYVGFDNHGDGVPQWFWFAQNKNSAWQKSLPLAVNQSTATSSTTTILSDSLNTFTATFASIFTGTVNVTQNPLLPSQAPVTLPPGNYEGVGLPYQITATLQSNGQPVQPQGAYTVTVAYQPAELVNGLVSESTLGLYYWDGSHWVEEASSAVDTLNHTVTAHPNHFSFWRLLGLTYRLYLPQVVR